MTVSRGFAVIVVSSALFAAGGGTAGYALARVMPDYYRGVCLGGISPEFDPMQAGIGLGISQGLITGAIAGSMMVLAFASSGMSREGREPPPSWQRYVSHLGWIVAAAALLLVVVPISWVLGAISGTLNEREARFKHEREALELVLSADRAFRGIEMMFDTGQGNALLQGRLRNREDYDRLGREVRRTVGELFIEERMRGVSVSNPGESLEPGKATSGAGVD